MVNYVNDSSSTQTKAAMSSILQPKIRVAYFIVNSVNVDCCVCQLEYFILHP